MIYKTQPWVFSATPQRARPRRRFGGDQPHGHAPGLDGSFCKIQRERVHERGRQRVAHRREAEQERWRARDGVTDGKARIH